MITQRSYSYWFLKTYGRDGYYNNGCSGPMIAMMILLLFLLCGCKSVQYIPVETVKHDSILVEKIVTIADTTKENHKEKETSWMTIHEADSAELAELGIKLGGVQKALVIERNKVRELENIISSNTKQESKSDSVIVKEKEVKVPYPVERKLSSFEQFCLDFGKVTTGVTIAVIIAAIVMMIRWIRRKIIS